MRATTLAIVVLMILFMMSLRVIGKILVKYYKKVMRLMIKTIVIITIIVIGKFYTGAYAECLKRGLRLMCLGSSLLQTGAKYLLSEALQFLVATGESTTALKDSSHRVESPKSNHKFSLKRKFRRGDKRVSKQNFNENLLNANSHEKSDGKELQKKLEEYLKRGLRLLVISIFSTAQKLMCLWSSLLQSVVEPCVKYLLREALRFVQVVGNEALRFVQVVGDEVWKACRRQYPSVTLSSHKIPLNLNLRELQKKFDARESQRNLRTNRKDSRRKHKKRRAEKRVRKHLHENLHGDASLRKE